MITSKKYFLITFILQFLFFFGYSQVKIERQVIGSTGLTIDNTSSNSYYFTVGEPMVYTWTTNSGYTYTEGFQQPEEEIITTDIKGLNAFSPNGDGVNETWFIDNIWKYPGNTVSIFNRWGALVWKTQDYDNNSNAWDGTWQNTGDEAMDATYFYIIKAEGTTIKGWIEITR